MIVACGYKRIPYFIPTSESLVHKQVHNNSSQIHNSSLSPLSAFEPLFLESKLRCKALFGAKCDRKRSCWLPSVFWWKEVMSDFSRLNNVPKEPGNPEWQRNIFRFSGIWKSSASPTRIVLTTSQSQNSLQNGIMPNWTSTKLASLEAQI